MTPFINAGIFKIIENHASKTNHFKSDSSVENGIRHVDDNSASP